MEKQIEDLNKKKGSGVENQSTFSNQNAQRLAIQNSRAYLLDCQAFEEALRKNALPNTGEHPYNQLQDMLGDVLVMLNTATRQESKPRCVETVKTAANYIKRIYRIHRSLFKSGAADPQYPRTPVQLIRIKGCIRYILKKGRRKANAQQEPNGIPHSVWNQTGNRRTYRVNCRSLSTRGELHCWGHQGG